MKKLILALEETLSFLRNSQSSAWSNMSIEELIKTLETEIAKAKQKQAIDTKLLRLLFLPTADIQDTAIDNGWGDEFLRIAQIVDQFIGSS